VTARDDPFAPESTLPFAEVERSDHLLLMVTERGGHLGFLEGFNPTGSNFMVRTIMDFTQIMVAKQKEVSSLRVVQ